jgi:hypothetical protein
MVPVKDIRFEATEADNAVLEAHRQRPPVCSAPSLIWHIAVTPERDKDPQGALVDSEYNEKISNWQTSINQSLSLLRKFSLGNTDNYVDMQEINGLNSLNTPVQQFPLSWAGLDIDVLIEIHFDFVSFTFILDLARQINQSAPSRRLQSLKAYINSVQSDDNSNSDSEAQYLLEDFWLEFRIAILRNGGKSETDNLFPGIPFAKFFGLVLEERLPHASENEDFERFDTSSDSNPNAVAILKKRWPFILAANASADDRDLVACAMLGKRAIYVTAMGARTPRYVLPRHYSDVQAVRYLILVPPQSNRFQIGRLVEHINTMGTFRLIALKEFALFRQMGTRIRLYGHLMDAASEQFNTLIRIQQRGFSAPPDMGELDWTKPSYA